MVSRQNFTGTAAFAGGRCLKPEPLDTLRAPRRQLRSERIEPAACVP